MGRCALRFIVCLVSTPDQRRTVVQGLLFSGRAISDSKEGFKTTIPKSFCRIVISGFRQEDYATFTHWPNIASYQGVVQAEVDLRASADGDYPVITDRNPENTPEGD